MSRTLRTGLDLLEAIARSGGIKVSQLAVMLKLNRTTTHRLVKTLVAAGYVNQAPDGKLTVTLRLHELAGMGASDRNLLVAARPVLEALWRDTQETVHLGVRDGHEVVYIEKIDSPHALTMYSKVGRRAPLHCTGLGKALIAWLPPDQLENLLRELSLEPHTPATIVKRSVLRRELAAGVARGYQVDREEHEVGIRCVAAPIFAVDGEVIASISISGPALRITESVEGRFGKLVGDSCQAAFGSRARREGLGGRL